MASRTISIEGPITELEAREFSRKMHIMMMASDHPVHLVINSTGGCVLAAQSIFDTIQDAETVVNCEAKGACMSAAVLIVQACDKRWIHPNCTVMAHLSEHEGGGNATSFEAWAKYAKQFDKRMIKVFAERSGRPASFWTRKINKGDFIMDADQAVKLGLFDSITGRLM